MKGTERARRMAVMFTEKVHAEWMTCRDVVAAGRYPYTGGLVSSSEEDWKAVDEAMEAVQVSELRERDFQTPQRRSAAAGDAGAGALSGAGTAASR